MKTAYIRLDPEPKSRYQAFYEGLIKAGFQVTWKEPRQINIGDITVIWNKSGVNESFADNFERQGGVVLIAENGYIGRDSTGHQLYALARHGHNGSGTWPNNGPERWKARGIELKPYRSHGKHVLLCPNRTFGSKIMRMPPDLVRNTTQLLQDLTDRPVYLRPHPGNWQVKPPQTPLAADLKNCWAVAIWSSSAGVHALVEGVPVFQLAPYWICADAANHKLADINMPNLKDRLLAFERLAWAQWTMDELRSGEAFTCLLE